MPGSQRVTSVTAPSRSAGRGAARVGSKVIDTRVSTSAIVVGVDSTSSLMTERAISGARGSIRSIT